MKALCLLVPALAMCAAPAFASVTVSTPGNNATVSSPFWLSATASPCSSQAIASMGYSVDNSTNTVIFTGAAIGANVMATAGGHVLHIKSWGNLGASCVTDVPISVTAAASTAPTNTPASSGIQVSTPGNSATVLSPFWLSATASPCSSQAIASMGYSLDNSTNTVIFTGAAIGANVIAAAGGHLLHVKSWGNLGASCVADVPVTVAAGAAAAVPPNALALGGIHLLKNWQAAYDGAGGGSAQGAMSLVTSPSVSGTAREFLTTYTNYGGERYSILFGTDSSSTNFVIDTQIYVASPNGGIANIELDLNQVMPNGQTVIFGFQCDGWSNTWDYTVNAGMPQKPIDQWMHTTQSCNPRKWTTNTWHHLQISFSRDNAGNVTYKSVWFDGVEQDIYVTAPSAFALGWGPALLANFQVDGATSTSGSAIVYLDNMTVYRW